MPAQYPNEEQMSSIIMQIKNGKKFDDETADHFHGETRLYFFDKIEKCFFCHRMDTVVGSYNKYDILSIEELKEKLSEFTIYQFREQGFTIT